MPPPSTTNELRRLTAEQYLTPMREGGSLPAVVEADDGELYVMKFRGAGHGAKALIAELVAGEIARTLGLRVPELVFMDLDPAMGRSEPNPEIQDLLQASAGLNLALRYLREAFAFTPPLAPPPAADEAAAIVWFDAYVTNVDRTPRNPNLLLRDGELWLIDHGSSLYFHHNWNGYLERSRSPFTAVREHVLLPLAGDVQAADAALRPQLTPETIRGVVGLIPDSWLGGEAQFEGPAEHREAYVAYLRRRLESASAFVEEIRRAQAELL